MAFLLIIISWFVVGILSALWGVFYDLKHEKYNENYFDNDTIENLLMVIACGYIGFVVVAYAIVTSKESHFKGLYKALYKIANPDKKEDKNK